MRLQLVGFLGRQVDQDEAVDARRRGFLAEALDAALIDEVVVAHQQDGRVVVAGLLAEAAHHVEGGVDRDAGLERALAGELDRGTVGHRIGERHAELDQVGAGARQALQDLVADRRHRDRRR